MPHPPRIARGLFTLCALVGLALPATAHEQRTAISADGLVVQTNGSAGNEVFAFTSQAAPNVVPSSNPAIDGSAVFVWTQGGDASRSPLITLDPSGWETTGAGYRYTDATGAEGGITSVVFEFQELSIDASGASWPWSPGGGYDSVWVHFLVEDEWYCAEFGGDAITANTAGDFQATAVAAPGSCADTVCGNGLQEAGEGCDDGNLTDFDGCNNDCSVTSTFQAIQDVVFNSPVPPIGEGCLASGCHSGVAPAGLLDLTPADAYESLLGADGLGAASPAFLGLKLVEPAEPLASLLFLKLQGADNVGSPMPQGGVIVPEHLDAIRLWIRGGAPENGVVEGTAELLGVPLGEPQPLKIVPPEPPATSAGIQLEQTPWPLPGLTFVCSHDAQVSCSQDSDCGDSNTCVQASQGEDEICMATVFDFTQTELIPESASLVCPPGLVVEKRCSNDGAACSDAAECGAGNTCDVVRNGTNPSDQCFYWHKQLLLQDPQSHHSIISIYTGGADETDASWGPWTYKFEPDDPRASMNGQACDPSDVDPALGYNPGCSGKIQPSVACIGYGPADATNLNFAGGGSNTPQISGSQEPFYEFEMADGVFGVLPQRGIIIWNSHAFNLTSTDSTMAQFLNIEFAEESDQVYPSQGIFDANYIFAQNIPPFEEREICSTHVVPQGARLFQLSSHTHIRGVRWRTWLPPNTPCQPRCPEEAGGGNATCADRFALPIEFCSCYNYACTNDSTRPCATDAGCGEGDTCNTAEPTLPFCEEVDNDGDEQPDYPRSDMPYYFSTDYSDPLQKIIDPPLPFDSPNVEDRTLLFCSEYDNGSTPSSPAVKRLSTAPLLPPVRIPQFGPIDLTVGGLLEQPLGGPCHASTVACMDGPKKGQLCGIDPGNGIVVPDDGFCDSSPGAEDGVCDACPAHGGVTTGDEMFLLLGSFYVAPEPSSLLLGLTTFGSLGILARRRRR